MKKEPFIDAPSLHKPYKNEDQVVVDIMAEKKSDKSMESASSQGSFLRFLFCAGGIFVCYFFYGILQERM